MRPPRRVHVLIGAAVLALMGAEAWGIEQHVQLETTTGALEGTLDLPNGPMPCPVVVIIAGSGPTDQSRPPVGVTAEYPLPGRGLVLRHNVVLNAVVAGSDDVSALLGGRRVGWRAY